MAKLAKWDRVYLGRELEHAKERKRELDTIIAYLRQRLAAPRGDRALGSEAPGEGNEPDAGAATTSQPEAEHGR